MSMNQEQLERILVRALAQVRGHQGDIEILPVVDLEYVKRYLREIIDGFYARNEDDDNRCPADYLINVVENLLTTLEAEDG